MQRVIIASQITIKVIDYLRLYPYVNLTVKTP